MRIGDTDGNVSHDLQPIIGKSKIYWDVNFLRFRSKNILKLEMIQHFGCLHLEEFPKNVIYLFGNNL